MSNRTKRTSAGEGPRRPDHAIAIRPDNLHETLQAAWDHHAGTIAAESEPADFVSTDHMLSWIAFRQWIPGGSALRHWPGVQELADRWAVRSTGESKCLALEKVLSGHLQGEDAFAEAVAGLWPIQADHPRQREEWAKRIGMLAARHQKQDQLTDLLEMLRADIAREKEIDAAIAAAERKAVAALQAGKITAVARRKHAAERLDPHAPVPREHFLTQGIGLHTDDSITWGGVGLANIPLDRILGHGPWTGPDYTAARFRVDEILKEWPAPPLPADARRPIPQTQIDRWWLGYVKEHQAAGTRPSREQNLADAMAAFPNHRPPSHRQIATLRALPQTPAEWRERGRRAGNKSKRDANH